MLAEALLGMPLAQIPLNLQIMAPLLSRAMSIQPRFNPPQITGQSFRFKATLPCQQVTINPAPERLFIPLHYDIANFLRYRTSRREALGEHYYSHRVIESRCYESGLRGDPPDGNCSDKITIWVILPPTGAIASSLAHRNYAKHLVDRYHEFASDQPGRTFSYPAIDANIKKMFGAKWDLISIESFLNLTNYLQGRIDNTRLGRINRSKGHSNYSTFDEYKTKHRYE